MWTIHDHLKLYADLAGKIKASSFGRHFQDVRYFLALIVVFYALTYLWRWGRFYYMISKLPGPHFLRCQMYLIDFGLISRKKGQTYASGKFAS